MRTQIQKVPQIVEFLKKKSVGLQHFKPTSSVCVLEEKDAVEAARCPHAASRAHSLEAIPGPTNWPFVGSLVELLRKGGLTRQHEALVQYNSLLNYFSSCVYSMFQLVFTQLYALLRNI